MTTPIFRRRIFRAPDADSAREWETALAAHGDAQLAALRDNGFNAVWLCARLREMVRTEVFPELAPAADEQMNVLRQVIARCRKHGLDLFLYLNEPWGFPAADPFWTRHPQTRGEPGSSYDDQWKHSNALCTSTEAVRQFLYQSARNLFRGAPDLAGVFLITASESHTHCYSHAFEYRQGRCLQCPRCRERTPAEVIGEVVELIQRGAREAKPAAEIIAWNWSWNIYEPDPQLEIIRAIPGNVALLADFERGGTRRIVLERDSTRLDRTIDVDEYSLVYVGPSARFTGTLAAARARDAPGYAKLQIGTTHEIATVPNLPLIPNLYRKFVKLRELAVDGFLGCWNFGNDPTLNTFAAGRLLQSPAPDDERTFLRAVAAEYFPGCDGEQILAAWHKFCRAMEMHPFSQMFIYFAPVNDAVVRPWKLDQPSHPLSGTWHVKDDYGDKLEECCGPFTLEEIELLLGELVDRWGAGVKKLEVGLAPAVPSLRVRQELSVARMIGHQFHSTRNIFTFYRLRNAWLAKRSVETTVAWKRIIRDEIGNLEACLPVVAADPRLGLHRGSTPAQHRFYDAPGIKKQIARLRALLAIKGDSDCSNQSHRTKK